jgi:hypothetical protein
VWEVERRVSIDRDVVWFWRVGIDRNFQQEDIE